MAELAAAATVIQLIQFSGACLSSCYDYIQKAKNAPADIQKAINDISGLEGILKRLHALITDSDDERNAALRSLDGPNGPFKACTQALTELQAKLKALTDASSARRRLLWPLEQAKIEEILRRLGDQKQTFIFALLVDHPSDHRDTTDRLEAARKMIEDMQVTERRNTILNWLKGSDPSTNFNAARKKHEQGTGDWFLQSKDFQAWETGCTPIVWLYAGPGTGKTILSSTVIHHLTAREENNQTFRVAYYYFDFNDHGKQNLDGCLRSLIYQLCAQSDVLPKELELLHDQCKGSVPSSIQLSNVLKSMLCGASRDFLIIDALDECIEDNESQERKAFLDTLTAIKNEATGSYRIFITSRPELDIRCGMAELKVHSIEVHGVSVVEDIRCLVRAHLSNDTRMKRWPENVKEEIIGVLTEKASGMFRWVVCQLESLRSCLKPKMATIKQKLDDLPRTLDGTYERIFKNMDPEYEREMRTILMLLAFSTRPMTIQEVAEATAVNLENQSFSKEDRFPDPYSLLELCSSLVSVAELGSDAGSALKKERGFGSLSSWKPEVKILQFAHFSVKEYVLSDRAQKITAMELHIELSLCHQQITEMCMIYLLDFSEGQPFHDNRLKHDEFPFLAYAALYWTKHMSFVSLAGRPSIEGLLVRLFDPDQPNCLMNVLNVYDPATSRQLYDEGPTIQAFGHDKRNKQDFETPLYYASYYGLFPIAKWLLDEITGSDSELEKLGSALGAAASQGQIEIAKLLLARGADPNSTYCAMFHSPLHAAAHGGKASMVRLILDAGADVKSHGGEYGTALHIAAKQGSPELVQLLINAGHDLETRVEGYGTPICVAARYDNSEILKILISSGAIIHPYAGGYYDPLVMASQDASIEFVEALLDAGADPNWPNSDYSPLHNAAKRADLDMMRLLIARGANIDEPGGVYGTPLKGAIQSRKMESFELMIDSGADVNAMGSRSQYPVDQAIFGGNTRAAERLLELGARFGDDALYEALNHHTKEYLVKKLLEMGADLNSEHESKGNPLQYAVWESSIDAVRLLLDYGAFVNAVEGEYGTALQAACYRGDCDKVSLLLDHGALVNPPPCGKYGNPLQAAATEPDEAILRLLIDHGADINARGGYYDTALQAASYQERENSVRVLLDRGAAVNVVGGDSGTALLAALERGHENIVKILLEHGAKTLATLCGNQPELAALAAEREYKNELSLAVLTNKPDLVQLLLDSGLGINEDEDSSRQALAKAACCADATMLKYLIALGVNVKAHGGEALRLAVDRETKEQFDLLLQHGANVDHVQPGDIENFTVLGSPLQTSVMASNLDFMYSLLAAGADVNTESGHWGTALQAAIERGGREAFIELLQRGDNINAKAGHYGTALMRAASKGDEELLILLLEHGADVNIKHGYHGNALQAALNQNYYGIANLLLDRGADPQISGMHASTLSTVCSHGKPGQLDMVKRLIAMGVDLEAFDEMRPEDGSFASIRLLLNPLGWAARAGNEQIVRLLVESGADVNAQGGSWGNALQTAIKQKQTAVVRLLLDKDANVNVRSDKYGTALQWATAERSDALIDLLLDAGADVNLEGGHYGSPLQAASRMGSLRHAKRLLEHGAKVNTNSGKFGSPLQAAVKSAELNITTLLIENGADINLAGGKYGFTLQAAVCEKSFVRNGSRDGFKVVELLLEKGADVNQQGGKYGTALQAASYNDKKFVEMLLKHGADPNLEGGKFGSPLKAARKKGFNRVVKLLLEHGAKDDGE